MSKLEAPTRASPYLFRVGRGDEAQFAVPAGYARRSRGYSQHSLVDRSMGSVHMGVGIRRMK